MGERVKAVHAVQRRVWRGRALRAGAVAALGAGISLGLGAGGWAALWAVTLLAARPITPTQAADRLDATLEEPGAVRTAWDHREAIHPMARAQRRRVDAQLTVDHIRHASPAPHWAWTLCLGAFAWPLLATSPATDPRVPTVPSVAAADTLPAPATPGTKTPGTSAAPTTQAPRANGGANPPATPPDATPRSGGGGGGATAEVAGVGASVGDRLAVPATAVEVGISPKTAAGIWLSGASGVRLPDPPVRVALAPPAGRPDDDITDPARPYPRRYHALIARWFSRR